MKKYVRAFTYKPKIKKVLSGEITQTIRPMTNVIDRGISPIIPRKTILKWTVPGDEILFHGWAGIPYRSDWSWRLRITVKEAIFIKIYQEGISIKGTDLMDAIKPTYAITEWPDLDWLAKDDGIKPPTGEELGIYFNENYRLESFYDNQLDVKAQKSFQIIKWDSQDNIIEARWDFPEEK